ncbi:hypothetical protein A3Q56_03736 [Intoshia linei]|uniref:Intimal thickness related receptor IRP domain-containing protein n=1 Tax=Intoshia linei TaxID=1819745 RepID=A0A177B4H7_9BILA|nr:hypothetical protein A3Q56_03736 [Intoshia linei]
MKFITVFILSIVFSNFLAEPVNKIEHKEITHALDRTLNSEIAVLIVLGVEDFIYMIVFKFLKDNEWIRITMILEVIAILIKFYSFTLVVITEKQRIKFENDPKKLALFDDFFQNIRLIMLNQILIHAIYITSLKFIEDKIFGLFVEYGLIVSTLYFVHVHYKIILTIFVISISCKTITQDNGIYAKFNYIGTFIVILSFIFVVDVEPFINKKYHQYVIYGTYASMGVGTIFSVFERFYHIATQDDLF